MRLSSRRTSNVDLDVNLDLYGTVILLSITDTVIEEEIVGTIVM